MKNRITQIIIIVFTVVFTIRVLTILTASCLYSMSFAAEKGSIVPETAIKYLDLATYLDSTNPDLYFQKYEVLRGLSPKGTVPDEERIVQKQQLHLLCHCINLCPPWPRYHLTYALILERMSPTPNLMTRQMILSELQKATALKLYSPLYQRIYRIRLSNYNK